MGLKRPSFYCLIHFYKRGSENGEERKEGKGQKCGRGFGFHRTEEGRKGSELRSKVSQRRSWARRILTISSTTGTIMKVMMKKKVMMRAKLKSMMETRTRKKTTMEKKNQMKVTEMRLRKRRKMSR